MAGELLMSISQDERERAIFRSRRKFQTDYQSDLATARDNGIQIGLAEGMAKGKAEGKIEIAQNLLKIGLSCDQIAAATGLTIHDIERLRTEF